MTPIDALRFKPHPLVRNPHIQTVLASRIKKEAGFDLDGISQEEMLSLNVGGETVYLQGFYTPQPHRPAKGLVLLMHGWLGNANATYIKVLGKRLLADGYDIYRLNQRDHGETITWNEGVFHGGRLPEVRQAVEQIGQRAGETPFYIIGFSMGGNFSLRLAWLHSETPIPNLAKVIAFSPSISPHAASLATDRQRLYNRYFLRKWRANLYAKQQAFPDLYDFTSAFQTNSSYEVGEIFIPKYTGYPDVTAYYTDYECTAARMAKINVPTLIITAADDPIIPVSDFAALQHINPQLQINIQPHGGHVGFVNMFPFRYWLAEILPDLLS